MLEGAHIMLKRYVPLQASLVEVFYGEFDYEMTYLLDMFRRMRLVNTYFINRVVLCFLVPKFLVERVLERNNNSYPAMIYDGNILAWNQNLIIQRMAD